MARLERYLPYSDIRLCKAVLNAVTMSFDVSFLKEREGVLLEERNINELRIGGSGVFCDFEIKFILLFDVREDGSEESA